MMADKLTKAQLKLLQSMRDDPDLYVIQWRFSYEYRLRTHKEDDKPGRIRDGLYRLIKSEWMHQMRPFFQEGNDYNRNTIYTLRPDAELTDAWLESELAKERQAKADEEAAKEAAIKAEQQKAVEWFNLNGPYTVDFSGEWFSGSGSICLNGERIASFNPYRSGGSTTLDEILKYQENVWVYGQIKEMLRRANRPEEG